MLACADDDTIGEVAAELGVSRDYGVEVGSRFLRGRLVGLTHEPPLPGFHARFVDQG